MMTFSRVAGFRFLCKDCISHSPIATSKQCIEGRRKSSLLFPWCKDFTGLVAEKLKRQFCHLAHRMDNHCLQPLSLPNLQHGSYFFMFIILYGCFHSPSIFHAPLSQKEINHGSAYNSSLPISFSFSWILPSQPFLRIRKFWAKVKDMGTVIQ